MSANENGTRYVVLEEVPAENSWSVSGVVVARSPEKAIEATVRQTVENGNAPAATYVAVPERSWQPKPIQTETEVTVKIG